jgi:hypothetical protein
VTVALFVVSAGLEIAGVAIIVVDVWRDRQRAREYIGLPRRVRIPPPLTRWTVYSALEDMEIERGGYQGRRILRQREESAHRDMQRVALGAAEAELEYRQTIADILRGNLYRRVAGPALVTLGIVLGTWANLRAL